MPIAHLPSALRAVVPAPWDVSPAAPDDDLAAADNELVGADNDDAVLRVNGPRRSQNGEFIVRGYEVVAGSYEFIVRGYEVVVRKAYDTGAASCWHTARRRIGVRCRAVRIDGTAPGVCRIEMLITATVYRLCGDIRRKFVCACIFDFFTAIIC